MTGKTLVSGSLAGKLLALALCAPLAAAQALVIQAGGPGDAYYSGATAAYTDAALPVPFTTLRYGVSVHYSIPIAPGAYAGTLVFVEPNKTAAGQRVITITIQGQASGPVDVFALSGGDDKVFRWPFFAVVSAGLLDIRIDGLLGNAVVSSIGIETGGNFGWTVLGSYQADMQTAPPASSSSTCAPGAWAIDDSFYYLCVAPSVWKRAALATWAGVYTFKICQEWKGATSCRVETFRL